MKTIFLQKLYVLSFFLTLICVSSEAKNYYISTTGSNANNGLSPATSWQTIAKLNASFSTIQPGDSILFKSGQTFTGSIMVTKSGTTSSPIVIGSYGTGAKPIITGLTTLTGWNNVSGNIWQSNVSMLKADVNILTIDGVPQAVGRTDWMVYQSASATQLTSSSLTGTSSYVGAEIVMRKGVFVAERGTITAQSGSTVTYANTLKGIHNGGSASFGTGKANYGFFLQRFEGSLNKQGEWYYNASTDKMMIYSTTSPSNYSIKASYVDTIVNLNKQTNITIANLSFEGAGIYAIESYGGANVTIKNCYFDNNTKAIYVWNTNDITIDGNTINNSFNNAILVSNNQAKRINVNNNTITNTGQLFGMGIFNHEYSLRGLVARTDTTRASNYLNIIGNKVINSGNAAIQFQGSNVIVRRNITDTFCNQIDDNGGIYTFINNSSVNNLFYTNRVIDSNFISNAIGAPESANGGVDVTGLYFDDQTNNVVAKHNTIWNVPGNGIQLNNPLNITITDNTVYNCSYLVWINKKEFGDIQGTVISKNVLYQKDDTQYNYGYTNYNLSSPKMTVTQALGLVDIDNNWISNVKSDGYFYYYSATGGSFTFPPKLTLSQWRNTYANDQNSILSPVTITPTNTKIEFNPSYKAKTISFSGQSYMDAKGTVYNDSATIPAWGNLVLISNGTAVIPNTPPVAEAPASKSITLPVNAVTLAGKGTDKEGAISSSSWRKTAGPSAYTIESPNKGTTVISGFVQGIYTFELSVTDSEGLIGKDTTIVTVIKANTAPVSHAPANQSITLPVNTVTLAGQGSDEEGAISSYSWSKISGPAAGTIESANAATTVISRLTEGIYTFELSVKDSEGLIGKDTTTVTVIKANTAPVSHAPANLSITLPVNTVTLEGYGTDKEGAISSYSWRKTTGPSAYTIESPNKGTTVISGFVQGIYTFELSVTDSEGLIGKDTTIVTVIKANTAPVSHAPANQSITLPVNTVTLAGQGSDEESAISSYSWSKISGPAAGTIESANAATTVISGLTEGIYTFELSVKDSEGLIGKDTTTVTVIKANTAPVSHAPANLSITLPVNTVTLEGYGTDAEGPISNSSWRKTAGPSAYTIESPNTGTTVISGLVEGIYTFELSVTDSEGLIGKDWTVVTVIKANTPPVATAPANQSITLPVKTVTLAGQGSDEEGAISSYSWSKISGPSAGTIESFNAATTVISALVEGIYKFELSVTDSEGLIGKDTTTVTVIKANTAPVSHAPANLSITLPVNTVTLEGYGTDEEGAISSSSWRRTAGPSAYTIESPNTGTTVISGLVQGIYKFELSVTDSEGLIGKDWTVVTVIKANTPPVATAPANQLITLPVNTVTLAGTGTDEEGAISSYSWSKISGPAAGTIESANVATAVISGLAQGTYKFELTVKDSEGLIGKDTTTVTVIKANTPPVSHAPANLSITLPVNKITLAGYGTDAEGAISSSSWVKISGPSAYKIESANTGTTVISGLIEGIYKFELSVKDSEGLVGKDWTVVTVNKALAKQAPQANDKNNLSSKAPKDTTLLHGINTGSIVKDKIQATLNAPGVVNDMPISSLVRAYPNPVKDITNVDITTIGRSVLTISVMDVSGKVVKYTGNINFDKRGTVKLDMSSLRDGYYMITVRFNNGEVISTRVIKQGGK